MAETDKTARTGVPSLPVEDILVNVADSVVRAQQALDAASLKSEIGIREQELDKQFGLSANWYNIPELNFDLRLAFELGDRGELTTQMVDAEYQSKYGFNVQASSQLKTRIAATPPKEGVGVRLLDERAVLRRVGGLKRIVETYDRAEAPYFVVRYQPLSRQGYAGGAWYALLMDTLLSGKAQLKAVAVVDDASEDILRLWVDAPVTVDGVTFTADQALAALVAVNTAPEAVLRGEIGIYHAAVAAILELRPFYSMLAVGEIDGMGEASMRKLFDFIGAGTGATGSA